MSEASRTSRRAWPERSRGDPAPAAISNRHGEEFSPQSSYPRSSAVQRGTNQRRAQLFLRRSNPPAHSVILSEARRRGPRHARFSRAGVGRSECGRARVEGPCVLLSATPTARHSPARTQCGDSVTQQQPCRGELQRLRKNSTSAWKWAGHELGRAAKSPKMSGALAPEGRLSELNEFFSSLFSVPCPHHSFSQPGTNRRRRTTLPEAPHPTTRAAVGKSNLKNALSS